MNSARVQIHPAFVRGVLSIMNDTMTTIAPTAREKAAVIQNMTSRQNDGPNPRKVPERWSFGWERDEGATEEP